MKQIQDLVWIISLCKRMYLCLRAPFGGRNFLPKIKLGDFITRSPSLLYYDLANIFSKVGVKTRHIGEDFLQHIAIDSINLLDVLCRHLKCLMVHRLAVKPHIVEVCALVIDDFKAVSRCLVTAEAHSQSVAKVDEVVASRHCGKAVSSDLLEYRFCNQIIHRYVILSCWFSC